MSGFDLDWASGQQLCFFEWFATWDNQWKHYVQHWLDWLSHVVNQYKNSCLALDFIASSGIVCRNKYTHCKLVNFYFLRKQTPSISHTQQNYFYIHKVTTEEIASLRLP